MARRVNLSFGSSALEFDCDEARFQILSKEDDSPALSDAEVSAAFDDAIDSQPLEEIISAGESALIVVGYDRTRRAASASAVNMLVRRLVELGVAPHDLRIVIASAGAPAPNAAEKRELLTPFIVQRVRTIEHDARD